MPAVTEDDVGSRDVSTKTSEFKATNGTVVWSDSKRESCRRCREGLSVVRCVGESITIARVRSALEQTLTEGLIRVGSSSDENQQLGRG